jgi:cytoskeletal protein CcmA (bactofilin family)
MIKRKDKTQFESPDRLNRIVEGTKVIGDIITESNLRIDGEVTGNVSSSAKVVIGENGQIKGNLNCFEADIEGKVLGNLDIQGVLILREKANVEGEITTVKLNVEEGAIFLGTCNMSGKIATDKKSFSKDKKPTDIVY